MSLFTKDIGTLDDAFVHVLQTTYYAEKRITEALPKMIQKATAPDLRQGFEQHLRETENQVARLERVFALHGTKPKEATCPAIDGIIKAGDGMAGEVADARVLDAALLHAAQLVEHYEIASYGTLIAWARELGHDDGAELLAETLVEEKRTDARLTELAESRLNPAAEMQGA